MLSYALLVTNHFCIIAVYVGTWPWKIICNHTISCSHKASINSAINSHAHATHSTDYKGVVVIQGRLAEKAEPVFIQFAGRNLEKKAKFFDETKVYYQVSFYWICYNSFFSVIIWNAVLEKMNLVDYKNVFADVSFFSKLNRCCLRFTDLRNRMNAHCFTKVKQIRVIRIPYGIHLVFRWKVLLTTEIG